MGFQGLLKTYFYLNPKTHIILIFFFHGKRFTCKILARIKPDVYYKWCMWTPLTLFASTTLFSSPKYIHMWITFTTKFFITRIDTYQLIKISSFFMENVSPPIFSSMTCVPLIYLQLQEVTSTSSQKYTPQ